MSTTTSQGGIREQDLSGKVAIITGASRGIGRATALTLATRGCSILGTCSSTNSLPLIASLRDEVDSVFKASSHQGSIPKIIGIVADIFSPTCAQTISGAISSHHLDRVDIFINNAADASDGMMGELTPEEVHKSLLGNIQTPVLIVDELVKRKLFQPESRIVYISSIRSRQPWSMQLMYAAGKSAGESMCRTWAQAFGGKEEKFEFMAGTTANSVTVGLTETESVMQCPPDALEGFKREFLPLQCFSRMGKPEDIADVVSLLCSRDARWITGSVISASGGGVKIG